MSESEGDEETSLERIHTFNLRAESNKNTEKNSFAKEEEVKEDKKEKKKKLKSLISVKKKVPINMG